MTKPIKKYNFKESVKNRVEIVSLEQLTENQPHLIFTPHRTDFYHIFLFEDCAPTHTVDFRSIPIVPYSMLFVGEGRVHLFDNEKPYNGKVLIFTEEVFTNAGYASNDLKNSQLFNDIEDNLLLLPTDSLKSQLTIIISLLTAELANVNSINSHAILKNYIHNLLLMCERETHDTRAPQADVIDFTFVSDFKRFVDAHYTEHLAVSDYSKKLLITEKRLTAATNKILGKTAKEIISERVVLEAKRLLIHSGNSIKMIAAVLGFEDSAYFSRYFKKHSGKSPVEFREQFLN